MNFLMLKQVLFWLSFAALMIFALGFEIGGTIALLTAGVSLAIVIPLVWFWKSSVVQWVKVMKDYEVAMDNYNKQTGQ